MSMVNTAFLDGVEATSRRYASRAVHRQQAEARLLSSGILACDAPERVDKRLRRLGTNYAAAEAIAQAPTSLPAADTAVAPTADRIGLERLLGRTDLIDVQFLERGYRASRAVGRITVRGADGDFFGFGTAFLISPRLLLTNHHVLTDADEAAASYVEFDYQAGIDGQPLVPAAFRLQPDTFFTTDVALDFTVVAVEDSNPHGQRLQEYGWLQLVGQEGKIIVGEQMNIVQHPNGEPKQAAIRENALVDVFDLFLHYRTDTAPGSSGSPVFNDQWEVVGLHHSGVPAHGEDGAYIAVDGSWWTPSMGEGQLKWIANEAIRVSKILDALGQLRVGGAAADLLRAVGSAESGSGDSRAAAVRPISSPPPPALPSTPAPIWGSAGTVAEFTVPLRFSVAVSVDTAGPGSPAAAVSAVAPIVAAAPAPGASSAQLAVDAPLLADGLDSLEAHRDRAYYDDDADRAATTDYYRGIEVGTSGTALLAALRTLITDTHLRQPKYAPARLVYPWVDLHPDRKLRSIYSGKTFEPEAVIRDDARIEAVRTSRLQRLVASEAAVGPDVFAEELALLEAEMPYNCEHVVPQSWFAKREPMRGDLHHLFACESGCNSFRGNIPYFDFSDFQEVVRPLCGRREEGRFEPNNGKGAVARATLYFLLRYPGVIGDEARELQAERLPTLLSWHDAEPVDDWERHRNAAIAELQGNRNPLIDHPEWTAEIPFESAFGR